jgi:hypothetical protein
MFNLFNVEKAAFDLNDWYHLKQTALNFFLKQF